MWQEQNTAWGSELMLSFIITFWAHCFLTRRLFLCKMVQRAAGSRGDRLRESWVCSPCGGEGVLGGGQGVPGEERWGLSGLCLGLRQQGGALQILISCSYTAATHSLIPGRRALRRACWHWGEVSAGLGCFGGCPVWLERRLEHVDGKPAQRRSTLTDSGLHF